MDLKDSLNQITEQIKKLKDNVLTEEATKMSFILPFITSLGYDVFNPKEVIPEFTCDAPYRNGDKVDYAININGEAKILVECKHCKVNLEPHDQQLFKYFSASAARFAILTNGIEYKFYTDIDKKNIMDEKPFLVVNMLDLKDADIEQIKKFHKSYFDENSILSSANELRYTTSIKALLSSEFQNPSSGFVTYITKQVYDGKIWQSVIDQFTPMVKSSISGIVSDMISDRLSKASQQGIGQRPAEGEGEGENKPSENNKPSNIPDNVLYVSEHGGWVRQDEIDAYQIIKNICRQVVPDVSRFKYYDFQSYSTITVDNGWRWFIRLYMWGSWKHSYIAFLNAETGSGERDKTQIFSLDEIYNFSDKIIESLNAALKR